jgi:hypothetical protein
MSDKSKLNFEKELITRAERISTESEEISRASEGNIQRR